MKKLSFILGPTASGKSEVAAELARRIGGEVISCDSMQVYRHMDVITQAPGKDLEKRVPHHLLRIISPEEEFSAARFAELASRAIKDIISRGKAPILAGGTGLYVKALLDGLFPSPPKDEGLRKKLEELAAKRGASYIHDKLRKADPEAAERIDPNNVRRVVRALEVLKLTGVRFSEKKAETKGIADKYDPKLFGLEVPRDVLRKRIDARVDKMFDDGIIEQVKALSRRDLSATADKALGIKEVKACLRGEITPEEAREKLKNNTRRYAKRQMTWFRADKRIVWINADRDTTKIVEEIAGRLR
jgi:tRNA dimethylallyltransferase